MTTAELKRQIKEIIILGIPLSRNYSYRDFDIEGMADKILIIIDKEQNQAKEQQKPST